VANKELEQTVQEYVCFNAAFQRREQIKDQCYGKQNLWITIYFVAEGILYLLNYYVYNMSVSCEL